MTKYPMNIAALVMLVVMTLSGCQTTGGSRDGVDASATSVEAALQKRAEQRWKHLVDGDTDAAYEYLTPGYRKANTKETYKTAIGVRPVKWLGARANKAECQEEICEVFLTLDYEAIIPGAGGKPIQTFAPLREKWIKSGQQWYFLPTK